MPKHAIEPVSRLYTEDGQTFLKVNAEHAISEDWLQVHTPELYRLWRGVTDPADGDALAKHIEDRFAFLEEGITPHQIGEGADVALPVYPVGSIGLYALIDEYEVSRIAHPDQRRGSGAQFEMLAAYIADNGLEHHPLVVDVKLRDWAEDHTPTLLAAWQRNVVAVGDYNGGDAQLQAMQTALRWSRPLADLNPELANPRDLPALSTALERAFGAGYPIAENLPRLAAAASGATGRPARELHYQLVAECEAALSHLPTSAQIAETMAGTRTGGYRIDEFGRGGTSYLITGRDGRVICAETDPAAVAAHLRPAAASPERATALSGRPAPGPRR